MLLLFSLGRKLRYLRFGHAVVSILQLAYSGRWIYATKILYTLFLLLNCRQTDIDYNRDWISCAFYLACNLPDCRTTRTARHLFQHQEQYTIVSITSYGQTDQQDESITRRTLYIFNN